jgi:excisionase family DNA binding protein
MPYADHVTDDAPREWMTVKQAATFIGCSTETVRQLYDDGLLNGYRTSVRGARRIYKDGAAEAARKNHPRRRPGAHRG